jgi:hypothetical protein
MKGKVGGGVEGFGGKDGGGAEGRRRERGWRS